MRDDMVLARYLSLQRDIAIVLMAAVTGMASQMLVLKGLVHWGWSTLMPMVMMALSLIVFFYWVTHNPKVVNIDDIRKRLHYFSYLLILAGFITALGNLHLFSITTGFNRYFIIFQTVLYGFCFAFILNKIGIAAYIYNLLIIPSVVVYILNAQIENAFPLALLITIFECGMLLAMGGSNMVFDSLINARYETQTVLDENKRIANHDPLTNLPNRRQFFINVNHQLDLAKESGRPLAVGIVDLDNFKPINDSYGHAIGDQVLIEISKRLSSIKSEHICYYRLGGDEFSFHFTPDSDLKTFKSLGREVNHLISQPLRVDGLILKLSASIGVSIYSDMDETAQTLYEQADFALYHAKKNGPGMLEVFSNQHKEEKIYIGKVDQALRLADIDMEIYPLFQPIVNIRNGSTYAFEALARWENPSLGDVPPSIFIPVSESLGMIGEITLSLFKKSISAMQYWPETINLSFNLSAFDITNQNTIRELSNIVLNSNISPSRILFEITETALLRNFSIARENIQNLRAIGARIALDDFGTGYSSLSHVQLLPLDKIKIDRSFISDIHTNPTSQNIVKSIISLCNGMQINCVAEGAENMIQIEKLRDMGCYLIQGYVWSKPLPQSHINYYLQTINRRAVLFT